MHSIFRPLCLWCKLKSTPFGFLNAQCPVVRAPVGHSVPQGCFVIDVSQSGLTGSKWIEVIGYPRGYCAPPWGSPPPPPIFQKRLLPGFLEALRKRTIKNTLFILEKIPWIRRGHLSFLFWELKTTLAVMGMWLRAKFDLNGSLLG